MATIRTAITLYDGVSNPIKSMHRAMTILLDSFESMQRASSNSIDLAALQRAREELARAGADFERMDQLIREADQQQRQFNQNIREGRSSADSLLSKFKQLAITIGGIAGLKKVINLSDQLASTTARLDLIVDDGGSVEELERKIMASAQRSRAAYFDTASAIASMGANAKSAFSGNDELIAFMEQINKQFVIGGASAQGQSAAMLQLTQAMGAGALRGEELNSILENAPGIARAIEQYMGAAEGSIKSYAEQGLITADVVKNAMFAAADETNAKFDSMPKTFGQIWTSIKNQALSAFEPVLTRLNEIANSDRFASVMNGLINSLSTLAYIVSSVFGVMIVLGSGVADNWSWIEPIVWGLGAALLAYGSYLAITTGLETASNIQKGLAAVAAYVHAAATDTETRATAAATAAQYGFNAALLASPITWVVIGVIALVAALVAATRATDTFGAKSTSVLGTVCGLVNVVIQFFKNMGLTVANIAIGMWEALKACCSNIGTAFHNVISSVQGWFYNLLSTALNVVSGICEALNRLPFVEFDFSGINNKAAEYAQKSAQAYANKRDYTSVSGAFDKGMATFDVYQKGWATDAFKSGAAFADRLKDKFKGTDTLGAMEAYNLGNTLDGVYGNTGDTAANTAKMADSLDFSKEELKLLREIAEREAINHFTTAEIKVEMNNQNTISGTQDLDGIVLELEKKVEEALIEVSEGVHT